MRPPRRRATRSVRRSRLTVRALSELDGERQVPAQPAAQWLASRGAFGALLVATALLGASVSARPRRPLNRGDNAVLAPGRPSSGPGQVTYLTSEGVFIDRGAADGLKVGDSVQMVRSGRSLGACQVSQLSEHSALCTGKGFAVGDRINVDRKSEPSPLPLSPVPDAKEISSRLAAVEAEPVALVDFVGGAPVGTGTVNAFALTVGHLSASNFSSGQGAYHQQRVDAALRDLHLWRGLHLSADVTVVNWARRPANFRSPLKGSPQLFVRQAEVSWHEPSGVVRAAVGRVWTRGTPGLSVVDGAQAGLTSRDGAMEGGLFGGLLPEPLGLGFSSGSWSAGAYAFARFFRGKGADAFWVQPELRAGWANRVGVGSRFEVAASVHTWVGRNLDLHVMAQAGLGTQSALDVARLDLGIRGGERFRFQASARWRGTPGGEQLEPGALLAGARTLHADGQLAFEVSPHLTLALSGGFVRDWDSRLASGRVGPELQMPRLLGWGGVSVGYSEEWGWVRGRSAFVQLSLVPHWRVRILARAVGLSYASPSDGLVGSELGGTASFELRMASFLWLRLSGLIRGRIDGAGLAGQANAQLGVEL